jgi:hypothetical protein
MITELHVCSEKMSSTTHSKIMITELHFPRPFNAVTSNLFLLHLKTENQTSVAWPTLQVVHTVAPPAWEYLPDMHVMHVVDPLEGESVPAGHVAQAVDALEFE